MKRPSLAFGLVIFTLALLFLIFGSSTLFVALPIAVMVLLFYIFTKKESVKKLLIIPVISITILISSISLMLNNHFVYEKSIKYADTTCDIVATVVDVTPKYYILKTKLINSDEVNIKILFVASETDYKIYDNIFIDDAKIIESPYDADKSEKCIVSVYGELYSEKISEKQKDFYYYILNLKYVCLEKLSEYLYNDSLGVSAGMLFGGTNYISPETKIAFQQSGVAHILSVSGLHTSLWCGLFISLFKFLKIKENFANLLGILILILLTVVSGFTSSVIRASFMMGITLIGPVFKKHSDSLNSLGLAAAIIILVNPYVLYSPSFYLSFLATLGVVSSTNFAYKINPFLEKSNLPKLLTETIKFIYSSVLISTFATVFTLPASVYYFSTVSIIAPITNLLTVNLSFVAMVATMISLVVSFIPLEFISYITELFFIITDNILKLLVTIVKFLGSLEFSSITANEPFVYIGIAISVILFSAYYIALNKLTLNNALRKLATLVIPLPIIASLILSLLPFNANTEFIVLGNTNTPNIIIRTGNHYAVINIPEYMNYSDYEYLPKSNSDSFDLLAITHLNNEKVEEINYINENYNIKKCVITPFINNTLYNFKTDALNMSLVSGNFNYSLENKINIRIFDTYGKNCAIIEFNGEIIVVSFSEYNDLNEIEKELGKIDVLILPKNIPDDYCINVDTLVVCSTHNNPINKNDKIGRLYSENFYRANNDDITIDF